MTLTTTSLRALGALSAGMLTLGMLAACTPAPEPKPTTTALFASDEEAFAAAEETYREYLAVYNELDTSSSDALEATRRFVTGEYAANEREALSELKAEHLTRTGESKLIEFEGQRFERPDRIYARLCSDVSQTDIVDESGESVVSPDRPDRYAIDMLFTVEADRVLITESEAVEDAACTTDAS